MGLTRTVDPECQSELLIKDLHIEERNLDWKCFGVLLEKCLGEITKSEDSEKE